MTQSEEASSTEIKMLQPGDALAKGRYTIECSLGRGKYADVYLARDRDLERHAGGEARVAIKILRPAYWDSAEARARLAREGALQKVEALGGHDNVVAVIRGQGEHEMPHPSGFRTVPVPFLVMTYVEHVTLRAYCDELGGRAPRDVRFVRIVEQLGNALSWIHTRERPVVHRDLASHNILLRCEHRDGRSRLLHERADFVQLSDFGLAFIVGEPRITQDGMGRIAANLDYAAPQILNGLDPTPQDDVYSLAVLVFEMLTGRLPFVRKAVENLDAFQAFVAMVAERPAMFRAADNVPEAVQEVVLRGLAKRREDRYASAQMLAQALVEALGILGPPDAPQRAAPVSAALPEIGFETADIPRSARHAGTTGSRHSKNKRSFLQRLARFILAAAGILAASVLSVYGLAWAANRTALEPASPAETASEQSITTRQPAHPVVEMPQDTGLPLRPLTDWDTNTSLAYVAVDDDTHTLVVESQDAGVASLAISRDGELIDLAWSPDGVYLAYVVTAESAVYLHEGEATWRLGSADVQERWPTWSPSGDQLALSVVDGTGVSQIVIHTLDTGARRRITEGGVGSWAPAWSPMGDALAYVSETKGGSDVYVLSLTDLSQAPVNVSGSGTVVVDRPAWSPDGTWVVYATANGLTWVGIENPAYPGSPHRLTDSADDRAPCVDPRDGSVLFHRGNDKEGFSLYRVSLTSGMPYLVRNNACCVTVPR